MPIFCDRSLYWNWLHTEGEIVVEAMIESIRFTGEFYSRLNLWKVETYPEMFSAKVVLLPL